MERISPGSQLAEDLTFFVFVAIVGTFKICVVRGYDSPDADFIHFQASAFSIL
jgi:hypothetical protein